MTEIDWTGTRYRCSDAAGGILIVRIGLRTMQIDGTSTRTEWAALWLLGDDAAAFREAASKLKKGTTLDDLCATYNARMEIVKEAADG